MNLLFVCLGNICRSPMAEAIMQKLVDDAGLTDRIHLDSAGLIAYHQGEGADPRMKSHAYRHGYRITHISRPVTERDFDTFDLILSMDDSNYDRLRSLAPTLDAEAKVHRMTDYCTTHVIDHVPDPYYGGAQGFENVIEILEDSCQGLLQAISEK